MPLKLLLKVYPAVKRKVGAVNNDLGVYSKSDFGNEMDEYINWKSS